MALIAALLTALAQSVLPMGGAQHGNGRFMAFGDRAAYLQFILTALSFAALTIVFVQSDFSVKLQYYSKTIS